LQNVVNIVKSKSRALLSTGVTKSVDELVIDYEEANTILIFVGLDLLLGESV
jgi:hypothetical protein